MQAWTLLKLNSCGIHSARLTPTMAICEESSSYWLDSNLSQTQGAEVFLGREYFSMNSTMGVESSNPWG